MEPLAEIKAVDATTSGSFIIMDTPNDNGTEVREAAGGVQFNAMQASIVRNPLNPRIQTGATTFFRGLSLSSMCTDTFPGSFTITPPQVPGPGVHLMPQLTGGGTQPGGSVAMTRAARGGEPAGDHGLRAVYAPASAPVGLTDNAFALARQSGAAPAAMTPLLAASLAVDGIVVSGGSVSQAGRGLLQVFGTSTVPADGLTITGQAGQAAQRLTMFDQSIAVRTGGTPVVTTTLQRTGAAALPGGNMSLHSTGEVTFGSDVRMFNPRLTIPQTVLLEFIADGDVFHGDAVVLGSVAGSVARNTVERAENIVGFVVLPGGMGSSALSGAQIHVGVMGLIDVWFFITGGVNATLGGAFTAFSTAGTVNPSTETGVGLLGVCASVTTANGYVPGQVFLCNCEMY